MKKKNLAAQLLVNERWKKTTPEERSAHARKMVQAREQKRLSSYKQGQEDKKKRQKEDVKKAMELSGDTFVSGISIKCDKDGWEAKHGLFSKNSDKEASGDTIIQGK